MLRIAVGIIISYIYSLFILPKNEGSEPLLKPTIYPILYKGMVIIPYSDDKAIHLHHWIIYLFICLLSIYYFIPKLFIGFSLGLLLQGIQYKDSFNFICNNPYK
jgi:hypothetical protein